MLDSFYPTEPPITKVLSRLPDARKEGARWKARCPAHDDDKASLSVTLGKDDETVLLRCFAGCDTRDVVKAMNLELRDLFPPKATPLRSQPAPIVATYDYRDAGGTLLYQVVRYEPKEFRQRRPDGQGKWIWSLAGITPVLYRLPEILASNEPVYLVEGEKDVDRLRALGLTATTNPAGAGKWKASYAEMLAGRDVIILPDNDEPGQKHALKVAALLHAAGCLVRIVILPNLPPKGDVSDFLDAGGTVAQLAELVAYTPTWTPSAPIDSGPPIDSVSREAESMDQTGIYGTVLADVHPQTVTWLSPGRLAVGKITVLDGDPGLGKSSLTLDWAARISTGRALPDGQPDKPRGVLLLNAEDGIADTIVPRLWEMEGDLTKIIALNEIPTPDGPRGLSLPLDLPHIEASIRKYDVALLIIDPLMAYLGAQTNSYRDQDIRRALAPLAAMAERTGCAVILVRHLNKASQSVNAPLYRGGGSIGIIGAARFGLLLAADPDDEDRRVLASTKCNLAKRPASLAFTLTPSADGQTAIVQYAGESAHRASDLLRQDDHADERPLRDLAADWLREMLANGPMAAKDLLREAERAGFTRTTLQTAKDRLRIEVRRDGFGVGSVVRWQLPAPPEPLHRFRSSPIDSIDSGPRDTEPMEGSGIYAVPLAGVSPNGRHDHVVVERDPWTD